MRNEDITMRSNKTNARSGVRVFRNMVSDYGTRILISSVGRGFPRFSDICITLFYSGLLYFNTNHTKTSLTITAPIKMNFNLFYKDSHNISPLNQTELEFKKMGKNRFLLE